jgi:hypothetical protein
MKSIKFIDNYGSIIYTDTGNINGKTHREDGPAVEYNGDKHWYINDKLHRENGPAVEDVNGHKAWYLNGVKINVKNNSEFLRIVKLKAFM